ncbi:MAG: 3-isopropylmalate dehydratase small subunit [Deltaproteobacteria bacterium]|jgi:3-isopropylmalate/(R)-2-methylmalate dehydratase small subunit|nr:3-isopropylmalate dehydratase small subunit [Deltaproteobacteria bacterium]
MQTKFAGKAFVFGKNIDTDQIYPGRYLDLTDPPDVAEHAMEGASDARFAADFKAGDIIVAETNFGCGSSREHAVVTLKAVGVAAVLAESFARIFYRNGINLGVPLLVSPGIAGKVSRGDELEIDLAGCAVRNATKGESYPLEPVTDYAKNILEAGGIKPLLKAEYGEK